MPVPTAITDLSSTASSNSPAGTDSPVDGDNFIRALSKFIRDLYDGALTLSNKTLAAPTITGLATFTGAASGITDLATTGNTVLGNASTDTLDVGNGGLIKDASGNVGLGTSTPTAGLELARGAAANAEFVLRGNAAAYGAGFSIQMRSDNDAYLFHRANANMLFATNGVERLRITAAGLIQDAAGIELGFKGLPAASVTTGAFVAADRGKCVYATAGVTVPNATMAARDVVVLQNTTGANQTITASIATLRQTGTTNTGNRTLLPYGRASIVFESSTLGYISGDVT